MPEILEQGRAAKNIILVNRLVDLHVCAKDKDWLKVEETANLVLEIDPSHETAHYWLGTALLANKLAGEAVQHLAMAVGSVPHFTNAQFRLARAFMALKDHERAKFHMQAHANLSPEAPLAPMFLSDLLRAEGRLSDADSLLLKAFRLSPENSSVLARMTKYALLA